MRQLEDEEYVPGGPPQSERIFVGCFAFVFLLLIFIIAAAFAFRSVCACTVHVTATTGRTVDIPDNLNIRLVSYRVLRGAAATPAGSGLQYVITHWTIHNPSSNPRRLLPIEAISGLHTLGAVQGAVPTPDTLPRVPIPARATIHATAAFLIERHSKAELVYRSTNYLVAWPINH